MVKNKSRALARELFWNDHDKQQYQCPDCGRSQESITTTFEVHHLDGNALNNSLDNLIALCPLCHKLREGKRPSRYEMEIYENSVEDLGTNGVIDRVQEIGIKEEPEQDSEVDDGNSSTDESTEPRCPDCGKYLILGVDEIKYQCSNCDGEYRKLIFENKESFKNLADSDSPASDLCKAALEVEGLR